MAISQADCSALLERTRGNALAALREAGATPLQAARAVKMWKERHGDPSIHHPEKAGQVHELVKALGPAPLRIYEACAYLGRTGRLGYLNAAWAKYGQVTAKGPHDGPVEAVARREVATGARYDVVDLDLYNCSRAVLTCGVLRLLRPGGLLVTTWASSPLMTMNRGYLERTYGISCPPTIYDLIKCIESCVASCGRKALPCPGAKKYGSVWRIPTLVR